ncbi:unnamed protein product [Ilex paraguariensis]|uniref:Uncharacterized protein n=1 Tax=Ilex paraguariensis TaxID=185542 RepID=A0ABC8T9L4_9AQUA
MYICGCAAPSSPADGLQMKGSTKGIGLVLMGSNKSWLIIWVMFYTFLLSFVQGMGNLDDFFHDYAYKAFIKPRTGILDNISLPANFSGMEVSIVRLRSGSFWARGANFSFFHIPPRIIPMPFVKRLDILYQNLGNWSSLYYNVPNYNLVTPVVGFLTYNPNSSTGGDGMLNLSIRGDPILVRFPEILLPENKNLTMKCVRFGTNGSVEFSNVTMPNTCVANGQGHFSIVIPTSHSKKKVRFLKWWVMGFGVGVLGLVLIGFAGILTYKLVSRKRLGQMGRESERSEALDTVWVGRSRMPSASGMRTQPVLENDYVP